MMRDTRRFYIVAAEQYFKGIKSYGRAITLMPDDKVAVVDLNDCIMHYISVQELKNLPKDMFCAYPTLEYGGTLGFRSGYSCIMGNRHTHLKLDGLTAYRCRTLYMSCDHQDIVTILVDNVAYGLRCHYNKIVAVEGDKEYDLLEKASRDCYIYPMLVYRLRDSLVIGYEVRYGFTEGDKYYDYTFSLSIAYDLRTNHFLGYCIYGATPRGCLADKDLILPSLVKEIYRWT